jgi:hypothetical protein
MIEGSGRLPRVAALAAACLFVTPASAGDKPATTPEIRAAESGPPEVAADISTNPGADTHFTIRKPQAPSAFHAFRSAPNGTSVNVFQAMTLNGSVIDSTNANFLATATPDNVNFSGWGIRGGAGSSPLVVANFGAWFENNNHIVWTQEIDVNNEGATQPEGSDKGGIGLAVHTGSTYSPDTAITVRRMKGAGSGPGFLRGVVIEGARTVGLRIVAMDTTSYPGLQPAAPGTITALQVARSSDAAARFTLNERGAMVWGSGAAAGDVTLSRTAPSVLTVEGAINDTAAWTAFAPVCRATSGTIAKARAAGRYSRIGQRVFFTLNLQITRNGTGVGAIRCSLPFAASEALIQTASGRDVAAPGRALAATLFGQMMEIGDYTGAYPGANGAVLALSGTYEAQ